MPKPKILVVGDELDMCIFLTNLLQSNGFALTEAHDRIEGLHKARSENPALIIMDGTMAGREGMRLYRSLKNDQTLSAVPVVMLATIDCKTLFQFGKLHPEQDRPGFPVPEACMEKPPEAKELLALARRLTHTPAAGRPQNAQKLDGVRKRSLHDHQNRLLHLPLRNQYRLQGQGCKRWPNSSPP